MIRTQRSKPVLHKNGINGSLCVEQVYAKGERCSETNHRLEALWEITVRKKYQQAHGTSENGGGGVFQQEHLLHRSEKIGIQLVQACNSNEKEIKHEIVPGGGLADRISG